jgi:hypothetical protein
VRPPVSLGWWVDPGDARQFGWLGRFPDELFWVSQVGRGQDGGSFGTDRGGVAVVHIGGGVKAQVNTLDGRSRGRCGDCIGGQECRENVGVDHVLVDDLNDNDVACREAATDVVDHCFRPDGSPG